MASLSSEPDTAPAVADAPLVDLHDAQQHPGAQEAQSQPRQPGMSTHSSHSNSGPAAAAKPSAANMAEDEPHSTSSPTGTGKQTTAAAGAAATGPPVVQGHGQSASQLAAHAAKQPAAVSPVAVAALLALLQACLGNREMPTLQGIIREAENRQGSATDSSEATVTDSSAPDKSSVQAAQGTRSETGAEVTSIGGAAATGDEQPQATTTARVSQRDTLSANVSAARTKQQQTGSPESQQQSTCASKQQASGAPRLTGQGSSATAGGEHDSAAVQVRWYDARARVAVRRVAEWLNVPWGKVAAYECLLAEQSLQVSPSAPVCVASVIAYECLLAEQSLQVLSLLLVVLLLLDALLQGFRCFMLKGFRHVLR